MSNPSWPQSRILHMSNTPENSVTVYYDGDCPLCLREIGFYRRRRGAHNINWEDVSASGGERCELETCDLLARFHVRSADGTLYSGARAFAEMWIALPAFRWVGLIAKTPPLVWGLEALYRAFLMVRPALQNLTRRLTA